VHRPTTFSRHAFQRAGERLTMESQEIGDLLDWDLAVKVGEEDGTRRVHRLFYSSEDMQCFVAIQDEKTKTIVTILPVDYYETPAWKIPRVLLDEAEQKVSWQAKPSAPEAEKGSVDTQHGSSNAGTVFKLSGTLVVSAWQPRIANLGSWPSAPYGGIIARLLGDNRFHDEMRTRLAAKRREGEFVVGLTVRHGRKGDMVWVNNFPDSN
jgi:hypothetical protein